MSREHLEIIGDKKYRDIVLDKCGLYWFERMFFKPVITCTIYHNNSIEIYVKVRDKRLLRIDLPYKYFNK